MPATSRLFAIIAGIAGLLAVAAGAFGAHALRETLDARLLAVFETGARYHLLHSVALLAVAWLCATAPGRLASAAGWLFVVGIVIFAGSLYALALSGIRAFGAITPIGGVALIAGWLCVGLAAFRTPKV